MYRLQNWYDDAETLSLAILKGRCLKLGDTESLNNLIDLYEAWGKLRKAKEWRAKLPQVEAVKE